MVTSFCYGRPTYVGPIPSMLQNQIKCQNNQKKFEDAYFIFCHLKLEIVTKKEKQTIQQVLG